MGVVVDEEHFLVIKFAHNALEFVVRPDIVLIAERDNVARAKFGRAQEVFCIAEPALVTKNTNGEGSRLGKVPNNINGAVGGTIVHDDEFERPTALPRQASQLLGQVSLAIVGSQRNGDSTTNQGAILPHKLHALAQESGTSIYTNGLSQGI
jgi:hypothetical protein